MVNVRDHDAEDYCAGPLLSPNATQNPDLGVMSSSIEYRPGVWLNMRNQSRLEFCPHGRQYSHPIKTGESNSG